MGKAPTHRLGIPPKGGGSRQGLFTCTGTPGGGSHTTPQSESVEGIPRPEDPPRRVPAGSPPPSTPLTGTVRVRDAGPGLADYTSGPSPPMTAWKPACWGREPGAGGAGGGAGCSGGGARLEHTHPLRPPPGATAARAPARPPPGQWVRPAPPPAPRRAALTAQLAISHQNEAQRDRGRTAGGLRVAVGPDANGRPPPAPGSAARELRQSGGPQQGQRPRGGGAPGGGSARGEAAHSSCSHLVWKMRMTHPAASPWALPPPPRPTSYSLGNPDPRLWPWRHSPSKYPTTECPNELSQNVWLAQLFLMCFLHFLAFCFQQQNRTVCNITHFLPQQPLSSDCLNSQLVRRPAVLKCL